MATAQSVLAKLRTEQGRADARWAISRGVNKVLYRCGFALFSDHFYQPLPQRSALENGGFLPDAVGGSMERQVPYVEQLLSAHRLESDLLLAAFGYDARCSQLPLVDAALLYALVREVKPHRVIEIGAGGSTQVFAAALHQNALADHVSSRLTSIDPYSVPALAARLNDNVVFEHLEQPVQAAAAELWASLGRNDILFVDSSHVFKTGSDVEHEFLHIYPSLAPGVIVHIHDIFFPNAYPAAWDLKRFQFWNEQQVLGSVLQNTNRYEVLACLSAIHEGNPGFLRRLVPGYSEEYSPGSIWVKVLDRP